MKTSVNPVNAGSMADIAFLLLIFFLVSTTIQNDVGINQKLPARCEGDCTGNIKENNILEISLNKMNQVMVKGKIIPFQELKEALITFVDNNKDKSCTYCNGKSIKTLSDHPTKAVISLKTDRETSYKTFVTVQNILAGGYNELRNTYALKIYDKGLEDLNEKELKEVQKAYPKVISEAEVN
ncbi:ExbD/TolR family protein [Abyssalbus ytuae]|uniref:Biopolymer transporter ExbD n=1 Tax=Abyssalbus ytuae TaxID=2926907 RepID=A0A9E6ZYH0_9FLAO|nr:biopolymer transporter ExbD [Abyssalbus ytuae]UOB17527.1 biopolymer transporter ExbD [Abyssalbus ytuae]